MDLRWQRFSSCWLPPPRGLRVVRHLLLTIPTHRAPATGKSIWPVSWRKGAPGPTARAPLADINYGLGPRIQLKFEIPWLNVRETEKPVQAGPGDSNLGVKWRFLGQEGQRIAWATYPQLEVNTGRVMSEKGLVHDGSQFLLPTELTIQISRLEINGEVGRKFVQKGEDGWNFGLATEVEFDRGFELVGELAGEQSGTSTADLIVNGGFRKQVSRQIVLLTAAGRGVRGPADERRRLRLYMGLQLNLPHSIHSANQPTHDKRQRMSRLSERFLPPAGVYR